VKERTRVPGLSADRADIIVAGLAIVDGVLKRLGANRVRVHEGGIRDGILLSMVGEAGDGADGSAKRDPMRSARRFAKACAYEAAHAKHVTALALQIFDQLAEQKARVKAAPGMEFGPEQRLLLEAASLLHDVGYLINYAQHHKHSYHLIIHADLPGLTTSQTQVIANVARYHRAADPKVRHRTFAVLSDQSQALVRGLSGILRIADGLDRTHMQSVRGVGLKIEKGGAFFSVEADREPAVDVWGAVRKSALFKEVFELLPHFEWVKAPRGAGEMGSLGGRRELAGV
jgi:exopolyphosphatase/guanosine-5'-triphosphate,3'-diphosphate pyrophosphatase